MSSDLVLADGPSPLRIPFLNISASTFVRLVGLPEGIKTHYVGGKSRKHSAEGCRHCEADVKIREQWYAHAQTWQVIDRPMSSDNPEALQADRMRAYKAAHTNLEFTAWCHAELLKPDGGALGAPVKPRPPQGKWFDRLLSIPALDAPQFLDEYLIGRVIRVWRYRDGKRLAMNFEYDFLPGGITDMTPLPRPISPIAVLEYFWTDRVPVSIDIQEPDASPQEIARIELREQLAEAVAAEDFELAGRLKKQISREAVDAEQRDSSRAHAPKGGAA